MIIVSLLGIQPWEERYPEIATAMGIDPTVKTQ